MFFGPLKFNLTIREYGLNHVTSTGTSLLECHVVQFDLRVVNIVNTKGNLMCVAKHSVVSNVVNGPTVGPLLV